MSLEFCHNAFDALARRFFASTLLHSRRRLADTAVHVLVGEHTVERRQQVGRFEADAVQANTEASLLDSLSFFGNENVIVGADSLR